MAKDPPADPDKFHEAVRALRRRVPMTDPEYRKLELGERHKAFWVAGVTQGRLVQEVKDALVRAVDEGRTLEDFQAEVGTRLVESWGREDPVRMETIFRTNVMGAYNAGRTEIFDDPAVLESRPYRRFDSAGDSRVNLPGSECACEVLDGLVLPARHSMWRTHTPPLHHGCRCATAPLTKVEAEEEGIGSPPAGLPPAAPGFGQAAAADDWEPELKGFDPDIRSAIEDELED